MEGSILRRVRKRTGRTTLTWRTIGIELLVSFITGTARWAWRAFVVLAVAKAMGF